MKTLLAPTTAFCMKPITAISNGGHYLRELWSLKGLELSNASPKFFIISTTPNVDLKKSGKNKKIM